MNEVAKIHAPVEDAALDKFLEEAVVGKEVTVRALAAFSLKYGGPAFVIPRIRIYCSSCNGFRGFNYTGEEMPIRGLGGSQLAVLDYLCGDCEQYHKYYTVQFKLHSPGGNVVSAVKLGEFPAAASPMPSKMIELFGPEKDFLIKGKRCETLGLGVAAFAYYRRIVETQKNRIFDQLIEAAKDLQADEELVSELKAAKRETQFTKALEKVRHALPQALLIHGQNPLTLLHGALSEGLHLNSDEECLEIAANVRLILASMAETLSHIGKKDDELKDAVSKLLDRKAKKPKR